MGCRVSLWGDHRRSARSAASAYAGSADHRVVHWGSESVHSHPASYRVRSGAGNRKDPGTRQVVVPARAGATRSSSPRRATRQRSLGSSLRPGSRALRRPWRRQRHGIQAERGRPARNLADRGRHSTAVTAGTVSSHRNRRSSPCLASDRLHQGPQQRLKLDLTVCKPSRSLRPALLGARLQPRPAPGAAPLRRSVDLRSRD